MFYTRDHEWILVEDDIGTVGITHYAVELLGDITHIEFPPLGREVAQQSIEAAIESVKAASDIFMPVSGTIVEVNLTLEDAPETVNEHPETQGWLFKIRLSDRGELDLLMSPEQYQQFLQTL